MVDPEIVRYAGTVPQWLLLASVVIATIKLIPRMSELRIGEAGALRKELSQQAKDCEESKAKLNARIDALHAALLGEKKQRVSEQVGMIRLMLDKEDSPELRRTLSLLERVQEQLEPVTARQEQGYELK